MKVLVAIKQVPSRETQLRVNPAADWIEDPDMSEINEPDAYALEEALQLREKLGGEVVALCAGPEGASQTIREALAKGADRAIHIEDNGLQRFDMLGIARILAKAAQGEEPDLILTGLQSDDLGYGQTGVVMAEILGYAHATIIMRVERTGGGIRVKRELEDGWFQHVDLPLPAVLTIQSGINKLRYATLMGIKRAKTKEVRKLAVSDLGVGGEATVRLEKVYMPQRSKQTRMIEGSVAEQAAKLVEALRHEVRAL